MIRCNAAPLLNGCLALAATLPVVSAFDEGDFHKWAVVIGTILGSLVCFAIIGLIFYHLCIKKWMEAMEVPYGRGADPRRRQMPQQQRVIYRTPDAYSAPPRPEKVSVWGLSEGQKQGDPTKRYSDSRFAYDQQSYQQQPDIRDTSFQSVNVSGGQQPRQHQYQQRQQPQPPLSTSEPAIMSAYDQAVAYASREPSLDASSLGGNVVIQDQYIANPSGRQMTAVTTYRTTTSTQRNTALGPAYTGMPV